MPLVFADDRAWRAEQYNEEEFVRRSSTGENLVIFETDNGYFMGGEDVTATVVTKLAREAQYNLPVSEDPDAADWNAATKSELEDTPQKREEYRNTVRWLCKWNPNIKRALSLYCDYVVGKEFGLEIELADDSKEMTDTQEDVCESAEKVWRDFLRANRREYTPKEHAKRTIRDGETFPWKLKRDLWKRAWPPRLSLLRPEEIADYKDGADNEDENFGIITDPNDVFSVIEYRRRSIVSTDDRTVGQQLPPIPADEVIHTKIDCDTDEKRGNSRFLACVKPARQILSMLETELLGRKMQSSMVIQRKVSGGPNQVRALADAAKTGTTSYPSGSVGREKIRPGTVITTSPQVEIEFLTPDMNFSDASPLARQILLQVVAATGWPEHMITGDASQGNLSSTLAQEGPVVKMVQAEQEFFAAEFQEIFDWVLGLAIEDGYVAVESVEKFYEEYRLVWTFPNPVTRDELKQAQADNIGTMNGTLSRAQGIRNRGLKPKKIFREIKDEMEEMPAMGNGLAAMNPAGQDKQASSGANAQDGSGTNQGDNPVVQHDDRVESEGYAPPEGARSEAKKGLEWRAEYGRGGTAVGVARARDISGGKSLSADTIGRMVSFFARHEVDKQATGWSPGEEGYPSNGRIAWALWGGDAGRSWANKVYDSFED